MPSGSMSDGSMDGALDHGTLGGEIADRETDGGGEAAGAGAIRIHDDVVGIDAVAVVAGSCAGRGGVGSLSHQSRQVSRVSPETVFTRVFEQAGPSEVEHDFGQSSGEEDLHGGEVAGAVGQGVHQARDLAVDLGPIGGHGALEACGVGDGGEMQQQVGGSAEGGVGHHGVFERCLGEDVAGAEFKLMQAQDGGGGTARGVEPDGRA